ncbi:unnamed protein product [Auanema sp. JU1783]|nr:unnamed protein product [Auanema sp. JU1783]
MHSDLEIPTFRVVIVYMLRAEVELTVVFSNRAQRPVVKIVLGRESYLVAYNMNTPTPREVRTNQQNLTIEDEDYKLGNEIAFNVYFMRSGEIRLVNKPKTFGLVMSPIEPENVGAEYLTISTDYPEHVSMRKVWAC